MGHPLGLFWISFTEFWERFAYYGMQALLVLYMTNQVLQPGHVEHVWGFAPFRAGVESIYGKLSPAALASAVFGLYAGFVYLTPIAGGMIADRITGRTRAITAGALLMVAGNFMMAVEATFLPALLCLLVGVGLFKGNLATQVGELYGPTDTRRADGFQIYMLGIQLAVIFTPFVCGTLGEEYGYRYGFMAAGVGMLIGLAVYLAGRPALPVQGQADVAEEAPADSASGTLRTVMVLLALVPVLAISAVGNQQIYNSYLIWAGNTLDLNFFGHTLPTTWLLSLDAGFSTGTMVLAVVFWRWFGKRWGEPAEITKLMIGAGLAAFGPLVLAAGAASAAASGQKISLFWAVGFEFFNDFGFANIFPVGLALYARAAPKGTGGAMIGVFYTHLFLGNMLVGWLGGLLEKMPASEFWLLHAGLIGVAAVLMAGLRAGFGAALGRAPVGG